MFAPDNNFQPSLIFQNRAVNHLTKGHCDNIHNDFTYNDFTYNDFTYNDFTYNDNTLRFLHLMPIFTTHNTGDIANNDIT